ncbi:hypothetical protein F5Y11DRAFT_343524 [Daldinia sp. FL1419]|nr:hypothetical protein F5Y11DRAFT_343524 [Daldinia sp. FL1419]
MVAGNTELGADLEARDKLGRTAVHYVAALGDESDLENLLGESEIDINDTGGDGWTSLMWACQQNRDWNFSYDADVFLDSGADIWARGKIGDEEWSPLKLARFYKICDWGLLEPENKEQPKDLNSDNDPEFWNGDLRLSWNTLALQGRTQS